MYRIYSFCVAVMLLVVACTSPVQIDRVEDMMVSSLPNTSNDADVQNALVATLLQGMDDLQASAASAVLMDVKKGKIVSLVSILTRSRFEEEAEYTYSRAINSTQEPGRVAAIFSLAQAIELGIVTANVKKKFPYVVQTSNGLKIADDPRRPAELTPAEIMLYSSNASNAHLAQLIGTEKQKKFLARLGLLKPTLLERSAPSKVEPLLPTRWTKTFSMTAANGHGFSASTVQLAAAYSTLVNGGTRVCPSFDNVLCARRRVIAQETSWTVRHILSNYMKQRYPKYITGLNITVGGVSGSSELRLIDKSFDSKKIVTTFATAFPIDEPTLVLVVQLEDAKAKSQDGLLRNSKYTVVPLGLEIVKNLHEAYIHKIEYRDLF